VFEFLPAFHHNYSTHLKLKVGRSWNFFYNIHSAAASRVFPWSNIPKNCSESKFQDLLFEVRLITHGPGGSSGTDKRGGGCKRGKHVSERKVSCGKHSSYLLKRVDVQSSGTTWKRPKQWTYGRRIWSEAEMEMGMWMGMGCFPCYTGTPNNNEDFSLPSNWWHRFLLYSFCDVQ